MRAFLIAGGVLLTMLSVAAPPIILLTICFWSQFLRYDRTARLRSTKATRLREARLHRAEAQRDAVLRSWTCAQADSW